MVIGVETVVNIAALRAIDVETSPIQAIWVQGYYSGADGGEGMFWSSSDVTSDDNGGTIIVDAGGRRWYRETEGRPYSVLWFGAYGDGSHDDTTPIIDTIGAAIKEGISAVYFPGTNTPADDTVGYLIASGPVVVEGGQVTLMGDGSQSLIINGTTNQPAIKLGDGSKIYYRLSVFDLNFSQKSGVTAGAGNCGLYVQMCGQSYFSNLFFMNYPNALYNGVVFDTVSECNGYSIQGGGCTNNGISILNCIDLHIVGGRSDGNGADGWYIQGTQGLKLVNCGGGSNASRAFRLDTGGNNSPPGNYNLHFVTCTGDTSGAYNWGISSASKCWFDNCWGSTQENTGTNTYATGFFLQGPPSTESTAGVDTITFTGGGALFNNSHGVQLYNNGGAPANIQFIGFTFGNPINPNGQSGGGYGLWIDSGCSQIRVMGSSSLGNKSGPIFVNPDVTDIVVDGLITGLTTGGEISVGASPFVYANSGGVNLQVTVAGGTVSEITIIRDGSALPTGLAQGVFQLRPNDELKVTFSATPTMTVIPI